MLTAIYETNNIRTWTTGSVSQVQTTLKTQEAMNPNTFKVVESSSDPTTMVEHVRQPYPSVGEPSCRLSSSSAQNPSPILADPYRPFTPAAFLTLIASI